MWSLGNPAEKLAQTISFKRTSGTKQCLQKVSPQQQQSPCILPRYGLRVMVLPLISFKLYYFGYKAKRDTDMHTDCTLDFVCLFSLMVFMLKKKFFKQHSLICMFFMLMHLHYCTSCDHISANTSVYECGYLSGCVSLRPESKASHLGTAFERRVIDNHRPRLLPNHRFRSSRQTAYTPVCLCTHTHLHTRTHPPQMCIPIYSAWPRTGKHAHLIYSTSKLTKCSSIKLALIFWKPHSTGHWFAILNLWAQHSHSHTCKDFKSPRNCAATFSQFQCKFKYKNKKKTFIVRAYGVVEISHKAIHKKTIKKIKNQGDEKETKPLQRFSNISVKHHIFSDSCISLLQYHVPSLQIYTGATQSAPDYKNVQVQEKPREGKKAGSRNRFQCPTFGFCS